MLTHEKEKEAKHRTNDKMLEMEGWITQLGESETEHSASKQILESPSNITWLHFSLLVIDIAHRRASASAWSGER